MTSTTHVLGSFVLRRNSKVIWRHFWRQDHSQFYISFLESEGSREIDLGCWEHHVNERQDELNSTSNIISMARSLKCLHPVRASYPGAPPHATCYRSQLKSARKDEDGLHYVTIDESMKFGGIPYSDYFMVLTKWEMSDVKDVNGMLHCQVNVSATVKFLKSTWLESTIVSNTVSELRVVLSKWQQAAEGILSALPAPNPSYHDSVKRNKNKAEIAPIQSESSQILDNDELALSELVSPR